MDLRLTFLLLVRLLIKKMLVLILAKLVKTASSFFFGKTSVYFMGDIKF